jgi:hypothetical protein
LDGATERRRSLSDRQGSPARKLGRPPERWATARAPSCDLRAGAFLGKIYSSHAALRAVRRGASAGRGWRPRRRPRHRCEGSRPPVAHGHEGEQLCARFWAFGCVRLCAACMCVSCACDLDGFRPPTERANVVAAGGLRSVPSSCSSRPSCARSVAPRRGHARGGRLLRRLWRGRWRRGRWRGWRNRRWRAQAAARIIVAISHT